MDAAAQSDYVDARMTLRPARVAVVFDGGDDWQYWARLAIYAASQVWGGAGFIHFELVRPGVQPLRLNGQLLVEKVGIAVIDDAPGEKARQAVAEVCSPYCHQFESSAWTGELTALNADRAGGDLTPISGLEGVPGGSRLAAPADWGGPMGIAVAARCGALVEPAPADPPKLGDEERLDLARWLLSDGERGTPPYSAVWHPAAAVSVLPLGLETAFDWGRQGLTVIQRGFAPRQPTLLVAGDEAADFALALAWDRLYGRSLWLPSDWQPSVDVSTSEMTAIRLEDVRTIARSLVRVAPSAAPKRRVGAFAEGASLSECRRSRPSSGPAAVNWAYARCALFVYLAVSCIYPCGPRRSRAVVGHP